MVAYMLLCGHLPWKREQGQITTADLYVDMGEGKFFDRKVKVLCLTCDRCTQRRGEKYCMARAGALPAARYD